MIDKNMWISKYWHCIAWPITFMLLSIHAMIFGEPGMLFQSSLATVGVMFLTYFNMYVLLPRFSNKLGNIAYILIAIFLVIFLIFIFSRLDRHYFYPTYIEPVINKPFQLIYSVTRYSFVFMLTLFISNTFWSSLKAQKGKDALLKLHQEKAEMELKFLKSQVNPHFIFNALNSVYTKVYMKEQDAAESVLKLSDIFRYVLDDCASELISIDKEVLYLENYIDFQLMKTDEHVNFTFSKTINNRATVIAPLLFMPFLENCFKHSKIGHLDDAFIAIKLTEKNGNIWLHAQNSFPQSRPDDAKERKGVGLLNVRKQLDLIYPGKYELSINEENNVHSVQLKIDTNTHKG